MATRQSPLPCLAVLGVAVATMVATAVPFVPAPAVADGVTAGPSYGPESAQAVSTGTPVVVSSLTTESSQVTAEPDGSFQLTADSGPVRAMTSNGWSPIDTTLSENSDGTYSPNVVTTPLRFSGGGTTPMVSIGTSQQGIDTSWPAALPTPTVSGNTITYPNVRPSVDLVLTAQSTGFTETLVVKNAAAASDLSANPVVLSAVGHGVTVSQNGSGSIVGTDSSGATVFDSPTPTAWDSSVVAGDPNEHATVLTAANAVVAKLGQILTQAAGGGTHVNVTVPPTLLNSSSTVYPVYIDPEIDTLPDAAFQTVQSGGWNYGTGSSEPMRVGYCGWSGCTSVEGNARSYFNFDTRAMRRQQVNSTTQIAATVFDAKVSVREEWNAESYATPVNLTQSGSFSSSTTYPGPYSSTLQQLSSNCGWNNANYCNLNFNNSSVASYAQAAATNDWSTLTFALSAPSENNAAYWKKFDSAAADTTLTVDYNYTPATPSTPVVGGAVSCPNQTITYVNTLTPAITSSAHSYSGTGSKVNLNFTALGHPTSDPSLTVNGTVPNLGSDVVGTWTPALKNNVPYSVRDYASNVWNNNELDSAWTPYVSFTVDTNRPATPAIQSFAYPNYASGYWGATQDKPGTFTLTGDPGIAGFAYSDTPTMPQLLPNNCTYNQAVTNTTGFTPAGKNGVGQYMPSTTMSTGLHDLYVWAITNAHNTSVAPAHYRYYITPQYSAPSGSNDSTLYEAESTAVTPNQANTYAYTDNTSTSAGGASGGADVQLVASGAQSSFSFTLNPKSKGYQALGVQLLTDNHNATLSFQVNKQQAVDASGNVITQDTCSTAANVPATNVFVPLGGFNLDPATTNTLTITMTATSCGATGKSYDGSNGASGPPSSYNDAGFSAGVDEVIMAPLYSGAPTDLTSAFNNRGIGTEGTASWAQLDGSSAYKGLSSKAMAAAGLGPNTAITFNSANATFTMPATTVGSPDNVIAMGQTINMPASTTAAPNPPGTDTSSGPGYVDLLVASTCGPMVANSSREITLNFAGAPTGELPYTDTVVPTVAEWTNPTGASGYQVPLSYYISGNPPTQQNQPVNLYVLKFAINPDYWGLPITSITLPRIGTDLASTCDNLNNALHVFAVTTSQN